MAQIPPTNTSRSPQIAVALIAGGLVTVTFVWQAVTIARAPYPPLHDLPAHAAAIHIAAEQLRETEAFPGYSHDLRLVPNLGTYFTLLPLMLVLPPMAAVKVFLVLSAWLFWIGQAVYLLRVCRNRDAALIASLLLLPLAMGAYFQWAYVNWYLGIGLTFLALAHQDWLAEQEQPPLLQLIAHAIFVCLLFCCHLSAWVVYGVVAACRIVPEATRKIPLALTVLPSFGLLVIYKLSFGEDVAVDPSRSYVWGTVAGKLTAVLALWRSYDMRWDAVAIVLWLGAVLAWFRIAWAASSRKLLPVISLAVMFLILPKTLGTTESADSRVLPAFLICCLAVVADFPMRRLVWGGALALAACLVVRQVEIDRAWNGFTRQFAGWAEGFDYFPDRSRIQPIVIHEPWGPMYPQRAFFAWVVLERDVFVPGLFTMPGQHPLRASGAVSTPGPTCNWELKPDQLDGYTHLWVQNQDGIEITLPDTFERVFVREGVEVWKKRGQGEH